MHKWFSFSTVIIMLLATSCKPDDETTKPPVESTEPSVTATINGETHNFNYYSAHTDGAHYTLYLACCEGQGIDLEYAGVKVGNYSVGSKSNSVFLYYTKEGIRFTSPNSTKVFNSSITKLDTDANTISGTFQFEGCRFNGECLTVTNGVFKNILISQ